MAQTTRTAVAQAAAPLRAIGVAPRERLSNQVQKMGYALGYSDGYAAGYAVGYAAGYALGYSTGYTAGYNAGYTAGFAAGLAAGGGSTGDHGVSNIGAIDMANPRPRPAVPL